MHICLSARQVTMVAIRIHQQRYRQSFLHKPSTHDWIVHGQLCIALFDGPLPAIRSSADYSIRPTRQACRRKAYLSITTAQYSQSGCGIYTTSSLLHMAHMFVLTCVYPVRSPSQKTPCSNMSTPDTGKNTHLFPKYFVFKCTNRVCSLSHS